MFYTKYRPQKFSEISKPNQSVDILAKQVADKKTVHAYIFVGPRGTGKTSTARILAKALNCDKVSKNGDPCGVCSSCSAIKAGSYLDLIELDAASNRGIDDIRQLKDKIKLAPSVGKNKVYIIDEVHMLTQDAFNALLKTLEEPPKNTTFILCTTEFNKVPETIKSRCQVFKFKRASISQLTEKLSRIAVSEGYTIDKQSLEKIAMTSVGGFRDAETLLQQVVEGEISVNSLLSLSSKENFGELLEHITGKNTKQALELVSRVYDEGIDIHIWSEEFIRFLRDVIFIKSGCSDELLETTSELITEVREISIKIDLSDLTRITSGLLDAHNKMKNSFIPQLPLELAIIRLCGDSPNTQLNTDNKGQSPETESKTPLSGSVRGNTDEPYGKEKRREQVGNTEKTKEDTSGYTGKKNTGESPKNKTAEITPKIERDSNKDTEKSVNKASGKKSEDSNKNSRGTGDGGNVSPDLEPETIEIGQIHIVEKWQEVIERVKNINSTILALLKTASVAKVEGKFIVMEVYYSFHKERIESPRTRNIIETVLKDVYGKNLSIKCEVTKEKPKRLSSGEVGVLTDRNIVPAGKEYFDRNKVIELLDGGLPI